MIKFNYYRILYSIKETYKSERGRCWIKNDTRFLFLGLEELNYKMHTKIK